MPSRKMLLQRKYNLKTIILMKSDNLNIQNYIKINFQFHINLNSHKKFPNTNSWMENYYKM